MPLDAETVQLVTGLAEAWRVTKLEAIRIAIHLADLKRDEAATPEAELDPHIISAWQSGKSVIEIAAEGQLPIQRVVRIIRQVQKQMLQRAEKTGGSARVKAFKELQRSLHMTPADAAEWQHVIRQARR